MRPMKLLWGLASAVVLAVGCNAAPLEGTEGDDSEALSTESEVSAMGGMGGCGAECPPPPPPPPPPCPPPPPPCPTTCGPHGNKVRICHHAPPDSSGSKMIELCIAAPGADAHLREHDEDTLGCCPAK